MAIIIKFPHAPDSYQKLIKSLGGSPESAFTQICSSIGKRYFEQIGVNSPSDRFMAVFYKNIWELAETEGLPKPLAPQELGQAVDPDYDHLYELTQLCFNALPKHRAEDNLRVLAVQLLISLLSPEFKQCRRSYEATDDSNSCIRQDLDHCKERISGSHCEDCPYFTALSSQQHQKLLSRSWKEQADLTFNQNKALFLPEDFRALKIFIHLHLRNQSASSEN